VVNGTSGSNGTSGTNGTVGGNGSNGTSGSRGTSGAQGGNGSSGTSGSGTGSSGTSGSSGVPAFVFQSGQTNVIVNACATRTVTSSSYSGLLGGNNHLLCCSESSVIAGGTCNCITCQGGSTFAGFNTIYGGCCNTICCGADFSIIMGGFCNKTGANFTTIIGGDCNLICNSCCGSFIIGGSCNTVNATNAGIIAGCGLTNACANSTCADTIEKQAGSFMIFHPDPSKTNTHTLSHTFVESPNEGDNIYRFKITTSNNTSTLELPSYFKWLNKDVQIKVSPTNHFGVAYGIYNESQNSITFTSNVDGEYNVLVIGTRKDYDALLRWRGVERLK
jgi:hypothetical protein